MCKSGELSTMKPDLDYVSNIDEIESILRKMDELEYSINESETIEEYKERVKNLHLPFISRLEGVKLEWVIPDYSKLPMELHPENIGEEVVYINTNHSPIKDKIKSIIKNKCINL